MKTLIITPLTICVLALTQLALASNAFAQDEPARRTRVALGPQLVPSYPGADSVSPRPFFDVARINGEEPFAFEAADESFGVPLIQQNGLALGPTIGFESGRKANDVGVPLSRVGFTVEVGGFIEYQPAVNVRARAEVRKGIGGHRGWIGTIGADYIAREGDQWLVSLGPRVTIADDRYHQAFYGFSPADAATSSLPSFDPEGGVAAVGVTAGFIGQLTRKWGVYSYAKYDRLVADAAKSPIVRSFGSRDQVSGGIALTYTFETSDH